MAIDEGPEQRDCPLCSGKLTAEECAEALTGVGVGREQELPKQATITLTCTLYLTVEIDGDPLDTTNQKRIDEAKADIWSLLEGHNCSGLMDERVELDWDAQWEEVDND